MLDFATNEDFEQAILSTNLPIVLIFYADWCKPSKKINAILREIDIDYKSKVKIVKIDTEKYPDIADQYLVRGIPAFLILKEGKVVATKIGGEVSKVKVAAFLDSNL